MTNLDQFRKFAKSKAAKIANINSQDAVIYTRVSTKEQAENNQSLTTQKKECERLALTKKFQVVKYFGGTHESAKTDERKQFKEMLSFVRTKKVQNIIVYSIDRFSRSGAEAIKIIEDLRNEGIYIHSVLQNIDPTSLSSSLYQNMFLSFGQYENHQRRQKTMAGTLERLLQGYWVTRAPLGFTHTIENGEQHIVVNETGKLIRKAFLMKANEGLTDVQIAERLAKMGLKLSKQKLSAIFSNPFYCGLISHSLLDGNIIEGRQERLVSKEIFKRINEKRAKNNRGFKHKTTDDALPLKRFVKCAHCGTTMTGYEVKSKGKRYYKCNKKGCGSNKSAEHMHKQFIDLLQSYDCNKLALTPIRDAIHGTLEAVFSQQEDEQKDIQASIKALEETIENAQEKLFLGQMDQSIYDKYSRKFKQELENLYVEAAKSSLKLSNLEKSIDACLSFAANISELWLLGDFHAKQTIQKVLFPTGITYSTKKEHYRTERTNTILQLIYSMSSTYSTKNKRPTSKKADRSYWVAGTGLEPVTFGL
ncbi:recombinase family protein [Pontibacter cellulosilyticus]